MGVRQLQTFIQRLPNGYTEVSLYDECETYKRKNNERPILIIDLLALLRPVIKCKKELLCGLRHNEVYKILEELFIKLSRIAELIFYEDGPVNNVKLPEWMRRQNDQYDVSIRVISKIKEGMRLDQIISSEKDIPSQTSHLLIAKELAIKYGTLKIAMTKECDAEMAQYAQNSRVLAIMADDSDFLIFPGHWRYFSLRELNNDSLMTMEYNRTALREYLNLNDQELVLLATLNGNDVIKYDDTYRFHKSVIGHQQRNDPSIRFSELARFIRESRLLHRRNVYGDVAYEIYRQVNSETVRNIRESFEFYDINFRIPEISDELLRYCLEKYHIFVYATLCYTPKTFSLHYIDLRESRDYGVSLKYLFSKQIGVLLKNKSKTRPYEICTKIYHDENFRIFKVEPRFPNIALPHLLELLNRTDYREHDDTRFNLLRWLINEEKLRNVNFTSVPQNILLDILVLTYTVGAGFIDATEADLILLSIKHVNTNTVPENLKIVDFIHPRAFFISFVFSKCHMHVERCLEVTGLTNLAKLFNFDGVLFHYLYNKHQSQPINFKFLLGDLMEYRYYAR